MQIQVDIEQLRKNKLFIATPMYGGMNHGLYMKSCLDLQTVMIRYGIETKFSFLFNESLITRARNYLVDEFLRTDFTHMMFIDSDIHFDPNDIVHPDLNPRELENLVGEYVFNVVKGTQQFQVSDPLEVMEIGTGHMMIKRDVFDKMKDAYPQIKYKPDHVGQAHFDGSRYIHAYFDTVIDTVDSCVGGGSERYLSEDYMFCQMWRKIGGQVWLCPWMKTQHIGTYAFTGNMPAVAQYTGRL